MLQCHYTKRTQQGDVIKRAPVTPQMVKNTVEKTMEICHLCFFHVLMLESPLRSTHVLMLESPLRSTHV